MLHIINKTHQLRLFSALTSSHGGASLFQQDCICSFPQAAPGTKPRAENVWARDTAITVMGQDAYVTCLLDSQGVSVMNWASVVKCLLSHIH